MYKRQPVGVVSIVTAKPEFETSGYIEGGLGNFDQNYVKGYITGVLQIRSLSALAAAISFATGILNLLKAQRAETLTILIGLIYGPKRFGSQLTVSQVVLSWTVARLKKSVVVWPQLSLGRLRLS